MQHSFFFFMDRNSITQKLNERIRLELDQYTAAFTLFWENISVWQHPVQICNINSCSPADLVRSVCLN